MKLEEALEFELKKAMGYSEEIRECQGCRFSEERENPHLDRDWFTVCKYNNIKEISVEPTARCKHWKKKTK